MPGSHEAITRFESALSARMRRRLRSHRLTDSGAGGIEAELRDVILRGRAELGVRLGAAGAPPGSGVIACRLAHAFGEGLAERNQFSRLDAEALADVQRLYSRGLSSLAQLLASPRDNDSIMLGVTETFAVHDLELGRLLTRHVGVASPPAVHAATYSPPLQYAVLGLRPDEVRGPVLDVGSGPDGILVQDLRRRGTPAWGIDLESAVDAVLACNWLSLRPPPGRWGTIVSHLAFSLHFHHAHHAVGQQAYAYAATYRRLLGGLRPGGLFAYAPGLPFIESLLPADQFEVVHLPLAIDLPMPPFAGPHPPTLGATHVRRLG